MYKLSEAVPLQIERVREDALAPIALEDVLGLRVILSEHDLHIRELRGILHKAPSLQVESVGSHEAW